MPNITFDVVLMRGKKENDPVSISMPSSTTVRELKETIAGRKDLKNIHRQRQGIKYEIPTGDKPKVTRFDRDAKTLEEMEVAGKKLILKDIGMQFPYAGVFYAEYGGPAAIMALMALRPAFIFGDGASAQAWTLAAQIGVAAWVLHYVKRILETAFVHKFSRETMPITNLFKNCGYYWGYTLLNAYVLCNPAYVAPYGDSSTVLYSMAAAFAVSELLNLQTHIQLASANTGESSKSKSKDGRVIAVREAVTGGLFQLVACPNYTFEVLAWVLWSAMTNMAFGWLFGLTGLAQMTQWAYQKHSKYVKQEKAKRDAIKAAHQQGKPTDGLPKPNMVAMRRKAIIPFIL